MIYKRTHTGDPTPQGVFGLSDCMGRVRARQFDAVIGVGGLSAEPQACGIAGRITWVGIGARRSESIPVGYRGPIVEFERFKLFDEVGPKLDSLAPALAQHLFGVHRRIVMSDGLNATMQHEIDRILALVSTSPGRRSRAVYPKDQLRPNAYEASRLPAAQATQDLLEQSQCPLREKWVRLAWKKKSME